MPYTNLQKTRTAKLRWYYNHKEQVRLSRARLRKERLEFVKELKNIPCKDCGIRYPYYVMEFDHCLGTIKENNIATMASQRFGFKRLIAEIEKCEVVCSNCHRIRTHKMKES